MAEIFAADAGEHACPFMFESTQGECRGPHCMAWKWSGPTHDRCETDNLSDTAEGPRPAGDPRLPEGAGWLMDGPSFTKSYHRSAKDGLPPAKGQRWVRALEKTKGFCGRIGRDENYDRPW